MYLGVGVSVPVCVCEWVWRGFYSLNINDLTFSSMKFVQKFRNSYATNVAQFGCVVFSIRLFVRLASSLLVWHVSLDLPGSIKCHQNTQQNSMEKSTT